MKFKNKSIVMSMQILLSVCVSALAMQDPLSEKYSITPDMLQEKSSMRRISPEEAMLFLMVKQGDIEGIKLLIARGVNVNKRDFDGQNALHIACGLGDINLVRYLVENDANIFGANRDGKTPRQIALQAGHRNIVKYLDDVVAALDPDREADEAIMNKSKSQATSNKAISQKKNQQQQKAQPQIMAQPFFATMSQAQKNKTFFDMCVEGDDIPLLAALIESGVNVNIRDSSGRNGLHIACFMGNTDLVKSLVEHGADVNATDKGNSSARDIALRRGRTDIVQYLDGVIASLKVENASKKGIQATQVSKAQDKKQQNQGQKNKIQNTQQPVVPQTVIAGQVSKDQQNNIKVTRTKNVVRIYKDHQEAGHYTEIVLFKNCKDCVASGSYFRNLNGIIPVPAALKSDTGLPIVKNHLSNLEYAPDTKRKMHMKGDIRHSFPVEVEHEAGNWARVVIKNPINDPDQILDSTKEFKMFATIPGQINEVDNSTGKAKVTQQLEGVFEFTVVKSPYKQKGLCVHRFFAPKGIVGADGFGAKAQNKRLQGDS